MKARDITGQKFNMLTAVRFVEKKGRAHYWLFRCDCGKYSTIEKSHVVTLYQKSCNCLRKDSKVSDKCREADIRNKTIHGMARTRFYRIWHGMKARCNNKNMTGYEKYGGKGITVCDMWDKFNNFKDDMYESYLKHVEEYGERRTTLDRINSRGNYCKENCRWATYEVQNKNRNIKKL